MSINYFDAILYINLDHRKDRKKNILYQLKKLKVEKEKIHRIAAYHAPLNGHRGCAISHIKALDWAIENRWKNVLILEDDCLFLEKKKIVDHYIQSFFENIENNWDVFFLATNLKKYKNTQWTHIKRVLESTCSHAYAINSKYLPTLRKHYWATLEEMRYDLFYFQSRLYAIDRSWNFLQKRDRWYVGNRLIARQGRFYSDIEVCIINKINHMPS